MNVDHEIKSVLAAISKKYGSNAVFKMSEQEAVHVGSISTQCLALDAALGIGGVPRGRITELYGPESSGKSTLAMHMIAEAQLTDSGNVCYIDTEHAFDPIYAANIGVDVDSLYISQPEYAEQALDIADTLIRSEKFVLIVVDSVAALVPKAELDGEMQKQQMGLQARLMSKALRKITGIASKSNTAVVFINQIREKIGVIWGSSETTTGGRALKFYCSVRIDIRRRKVIKESDGSLSAIECEAKVAKNKVAPPFKSGMLRIVFGKGIDRVYDVYKEAIASGIIKRAGAMYTIAAPINRKIKGEAAVLDFLERKPKATVIIKKKIQEKHNEEENVEEEQRHKKAQKSRRENRSKKKHNSHTK